MIDRQKYGPETKYKKGLSELFEVLATYGEGSAKTNPYKVFYEALTEHRCILEVGSGWEKEAVEAQSLFGPETKWVSINPLLAIPEHNIRVKDHMDEHIWDHHIRRGLESHGIEMPVRSAAAAESVALPFKSDAFELLLGSWSVPTVLEEQIKNASDTPELQEELIDELKALIPATCQEYSRVLRKDGSAITFPIRDRRIVEWMIAELDKVGKWEHIICEAPDHTTYVTDPENPVNFLLLSTKTA